MKYNVTIPYEEKVCRQCRLSPPDVEFGKRKDSHDGYNYICKGCNVSNALKSIKCERLQEYKELGITKDNIVIQRDTEFMTRAEKIAHYGRKLNNE